MELNKFDEEKARRENALNSLETAIFNTKQNMEVSEYQSASTSKESEKILKTCDKISEWLEDEGFDATAETYEEKLADLQKLTKDVNERVYEHKERPEALKGMVSMLNGSRTFLNNMKNLSMTQEIFTEIEIETLEKAINDTQVRLKKKK